MKLLMSAILSTAFFLSVIFINIDQVKAIFADKDPETRVVVLESTDVTSQQEEARIVGRHDQYEVTAYTAGKESTGKTPEHPAYGVTASGQIVQENYTLACPPELSFGTLVYIPYFEQTFVCEDRGGAIKGKALDIYMENVFDAIEFGRRNLEVFILEINEH